MPKSKKFYFIAVVTASVIPIIVSKYVIDRDREVVDTDLLKEQAADRYAKTVVRSRIHSEGYTGSPIAADEDFEFHRIAYHLEN